MDTPWYHAGMPTHMNTMTLKFFLKITGKRKIQLPVKSVQIPDQGLIPMPFAKAFTITVARRHEALLRRLTKRTDVRLFIEDNGRPRLLYSFGVTIKDVLTATEVAVSGKRRLKTAVVLADIRSHGDIGTRNG